MAEGSFGIILLILSSLTCCAFCAEACEGSDNYRSTSQGTSMA
jgi:hypothetical protein